MADSVGRGSCLLLLLLEQEESDHSLFVCLYRRESQFHDVTNPCTDAPLGVSGMRVSPIYGWMCVLLRWILLLTRNCDKENEYLVLWEPLTMLAADNSSVYLDWSARRYFGNIVTKIHCDANRQSRQSIKPNEQATYNLQCFPVSSFCVWVHVGVLQLPLVNHTFSSKHTSFSNSALLWLDPQDILPKPLVDDRVR